MPPRLARLLAAIVATALVTAALWFVLRDDKSSKAKPDNGSSSALSIVCVEELRTVCQSLNSNDMKVRIEPAATTLDNIVKTSDLATLDYDAWVTLNPWPGMVDTGRLSAGLSGASRDREVVASTPLGLLVTADLAGCKDWKCILADKANKVGIPDNTQALSALVQGQVAVSMVGDANFGSEQFTKIEPPLKQLVGDSTDDLPTAMINYQGKYQAIAGLSFATERSATQAQAKAQGLMAIVAKPSVRADVVIMSLGQPARVHKINKTFTDKDGQKAFTGVGWTVGKPSGPNGLPDADVMFAIREKLTK